MFTPLQVIPKVQAMLVAISKQKDLKGLWKRTKELDALYKAIVKVIHKEKQVFSLGLGVKVLILEYKLDD